MRHSEPMSGRPIGLFYAAWIASTQIGVLLDEALAGTGIPPGNFGLLSTIGSFGPVTPSEISTLTGMPLTTVVFNTRKMIERGHVARGPHPKDRRSYQLALTDEGNRLFHAAGPAFRQALDAVRGRLDDPDEVLERVVALANAVAAELADRQSNPQPQRYAAFRVEGGGPTVSAERSERYG